MIRIKSVTALEPGWVYVAPDGRKAPVIGMAVVENENDPGDVIEAVVAAPDIGPFLAFASEVFRPADSTGWPGGSIERDF